MNKTKLSFTPSLVSPRRKKLIFAAAAAFGAVLVLPGVGPLTRHELSVAVQNTVHAPAQTNSSDAEAMWAQSEATRIAHLPLDQKTAAQMPSDFAVQLALCRRDTPLNKPTSRLDAANDAPAPAGMVGRNEKVAHKLLALAPRFAQNPSLHAAVLRNLAADAVNLKNRREADFLLPETEQAKRKNAAEPSPENLAAWHKAAQTGEALEPQNAFFPLMEAAGLYAAHRDSKAQTALFRASTKTDYDDHAADEVAGAMRLNEAEETQTALSLLMPQAEQSFLHFSVLSSTARLTVASAIRAEQQNRPEDGFRLRQALRRIGAINRENNSQNIHIFDGVYQGYGFVQIAASRPGGAEEAKPARGMAPTTTNYEAYLRKIGHEDEAQAVAFEGKERTANNELFRAAFDKPGYFFSISRFLRIVLLPIVWLSLFANAIALLTAGALAAFLARTRQVASGASLPQSAKIGAVSVILVPYIGLIAIATSPESAAGLALVLAVISLLYARCKERGLVLQGADTGAGAKKGSFLALWAGGFLSTALGLAVFAGFALALGRAASGPVLEAGLRSQNLYWEMAIWATFAPLLLSLFFAACAPKAGVPVSAGIVRGMRGVCVPLACVLVLIAVPLAVWSAHETGLMRHDLNQSLAGESRYMARLCGKPWPLHSRPAEKITESPRP